MKNSGLLLNLMCAFLFIFAFSDSWKFSCNAQDSNKSVTDKKSVNIIPRPLKMNVYEGTFELNSNTKITINDNSSKIESVAVFLKGHLAKSTGFELEIVKRNNNSKISENSINLLIDPLKIESGDEGYELNSKDKSVIISAKTTAGLFYGIQTLRQLLPPEIESQKVIENNIKWTIPCLSVQDMPRYQWRGMMLDCSRHFMSKEFIKSLIDTLAHHKMNRFHWHFTDDNGWRVQINKYPKLTEIGAWRGMGYDVHGGFYTKEDIKEIVQYAGARYIIVIPEIEMPAHSTAAMFCYPELTCDGKPLRHGVDGIDYFSASGSGIFCAGRDESLTFIGDVLSEVVELFDSPYIHIGGDERPAGRWEKCTRCQERIKKNNLKDEHDLQNWFMRQVSDMLTKKCKRAISWAVERSDPYNPTDMDDIGNNAIIQNWHNGAEFAAKQGWDVINSQDGYTYIDYPEYEGMPKFDWMPYLNFEKMYSFDPTPPNLSEEEAKHILGIETCLWTELVIEEKVFIKTYPRALAAAEIGWSPKEGKNFEEFLSRVNKHEKRLNLIGVEYAKPPEKKN